MWRLGLFPNASSHLFSNKHPRLANKITEIEITDINKQSFSATLIMEFSYIWNALKVQRKETNTGDWTGSYIAFFFFYSFWAFKALYTCPEGIERPIFRLVDNLLYPVSNNRLNTGNRSA